MEVKDPFAGVRMNRGLEEWFETLEGSRNSKDKCESNWAVPILREYYFNNTHVVYRALAGGALGYSDRRIKLHEKIYELREKYSKIIPFFWI